MDSDTSVRMARQTNDRLHAFIQTNPDRFAALGLLPTPAPAAAADELERIVTRLGFKGAMIHGLTNGRFIDHETFWPIFARAEALDVPVYVHPAFPSPTVAKEYYADIWTLDDCRRGDLPMCLEQRFDGRSSCDD
jgi:2,3-dihydroxybenzoate decarboxylase